MEGLLAGCWLADLWRSVISLISGNGRENSGMAGLVARGGWSVAPVALAASGG